MSSGEVIKTLGNDVPNICFVIYIYISAAPALAGGIKHVR